MLGGATVFLFPSRYMYTLTCGGKTKDVFVSLRKIVVVDEQGKKKTVVPRLWW